MPSGFRDEYTDISKEIVSNPTGRSNLKLFERLVRCFNTINTHGYPKEIERWLESLKPYLDRPVTEQEEKLFGIIAENKAWHCYWVFVIQADILKTLIEKGAFYGKSFSKKGWLTVYTNIQRKYDVVERVLYEHYVKKGDNTRIYQNDGKNFMDALRDGAGYNILGWTYLLEKLIERGEWSHGKAGSESGEESGEEGSQDS